MFYTKSICPTIDFFCYHTSYLYHVHLIDGAASFIIFYYKEMLDHAIFSCLAPFLSYHLMPRGRKHYLNMVTLCLC